MSRRLVRIGLIVLGIVIFAVPAWALDYAHMSNAELAELRGAITNAPEPEREAFQQEWEKRLQHMSEAEKKQYGQPDQEQKKSPNVQGRGYDSQGAGAIIYGGGGPLPPGH